MIGVSASAILWSYFNYETLFCVNFDSKGEALIETILIVIGLTITLYYFIGEIKNMRQHIHK